MDIRSLSHEQLARMVVLLNDERDDMSVFVQYCMQDGSAAAWRHCGIDAQLREDRIYILLDFARIKSIDFTGMVRSLDLLYSQYRSNGRWMLVCIF